MKTDNDNYRQMPKPIDEIFCLST